MKQVMYMDNLSHGQFILIDLSYQEEELDVLKQGKSQQSIALKSSLYIKELGEYQQLLFLES